MTIYDLPLAPRFSCSSWDPIGRFGDCSAGVEVLLWRSSKNWSWEVIQALDQSHPHNWKLRTSGLQLDHVGCGSAEIYLVPFLVVNPDNFFVAWWPEAKMQAPRPSCTCYGSHVVGWWGHRLLATSTQLNGNRWFNSWRQKELKIHVAIWKRLRLGVRRNEVLRNPSEKKQKKNCTVTGNFIVPLINWLFKDTSREIWRLFGAVFKNGVLRTP